MHLNDPFSLRFCLVQKRGSMFLRGHSVGSTELGIAVTTWTLWAPSVCEPGNGGAPTLAG